MDQHGVFLIANMLGMSIDFLLQLYIPLSDSKRSPIEGDAHALLGKTHITERRSLGQMTVPNSVGCNMVKLFGTDLFERILS